MTQTKTQDQLPEPVDHLPYDEDKVFSAGMVIGCIILAGIMLVAGCQKHAYANCTGASPEIQKAYEQLKKDGFYVSCRNVS